jgi:hypothetical protein
MEGVEKWVEDHIASSGGRFSARFNEGASILLSV